jgi:hypothetical protein
MEQHIRAFVEAHPEGWGHEEWLGLLADLEAAGVDVSNPDAIGYELENERLAAELKRQGVQGLGPKRIEAVVDRFGTLWNLQHADAEEVAEIKTIPGALAERVVAAVR